MRYAIVNYPIPEEILLSGIIAQTNITARKNNSKTKCIVSYNDSFTPVFRGYPTLPESELLDYIQNNPEDWDSDYIEKNEVSITDFQNKSSIQKAIPVILHKAEESSFARATHDFCNKSTWITNSVRVIDEVAESPDDLVFNLEKEYLIDVISGSVNRQDLEQAYKIIVKVDDVEINRRELVEDVPTSNYVIDHKNGTITFPSEQTGEVKVTYSYATDSEWRIGPKKDKILIIEHSEVQFSDDVKIIGDLNFKLKFQVWVYNPFYGVQGHPYAALVKIPYETINYNSMKDIINESNLGTGKIDKVADLPGDLRVFPFNYVTVKAMEDLHGAETRIYIEDEFGRKNQELTGSFATATFYLISRDKL